MSKPFSIRTEPWTSFDKQSYSIFSDDFVHQKLLTVKVNIKQKGTINLKNQISTSKDGSFKSQGEIKLWFPVWNSRNGALYFRSKNEQIKLHYDDGLKAISKGQFEYYNLYGSYQSQKSFKNVVLKVGANLIAKNFNFDNRIRAKFTETGEIDFSTGHKFGFKKDNWSFDTYDIISFKTKALINNAVRIGYRKDDNEVFFRATHQKERKFNQINLTSLDTYFTNFIVDYVRRVDDQTKVAVESQFKKNAFGKASFVIQKSVPKRDLGLKLRLATDRSVAACVQSVIKNYGKWTAGLEVAELGKTNKVRYGLQFEVNL